MYTFCLFNYLLNHHILHFYLPFHLHTNPLYIASHHSNNYHNLLQLALSHHHKMLYILIHPVDMSYTSLIHLFSHFNTIHHNLNPLHIFLINLLNNYYNPLIYQFFHFNNLAYLNQILYILMYTCYYFHYPLSHHIPHFYQPFHFNTNPIYIVSHLSHNCHNLLQFVSFHLHILLYTLIHLSHNSYKSLHLVLFSLHILLYTFIHLAGNSYNFLTHLSSHFNKVHMLMHLKNNFCMFLELLTFHFNNNLIHPVDNSNMFLMLQSFHFNN